MTNAIVTLAAAFISQTELPPVLIGDAFYSGDVEKKEAPVAYTETHRFEFVEGRLKGLSTEYTVPTSKDANPIAIMKHQFPAPGFLPDYTYSDLRNGLEHRLSVDRVAKTIKMERVSGLLDKNSEPKAKAKTLALAGSQVAGQGIYFWILSNLNSILSGQRVYTKFVVPGLLDDYSFHAELLKTEKGRHTIKVELDNWFFRLFASKTQFDLDEKTRKLLEYRGPSNVADAQGKYRDVVIRYR